MSNRKSPTGPQQSLTGFITLGQTVIAPGTAGLPATATSFGFIFVSPSGTATSLINAKNMSTNDVVSASPRGTVPLGTSQITLSHGRVVSIAGTGSTSSAIIELTFVNPSTASATLIANTWNVNIDLASADL